MPAKSEVRAKAEKCFEQIGCEAPSIAWVDRSKSGHRVKFFCRQTDDNTMSMLRELFASKFKFKDTRVWYVNADGGGYSHYNGIAFKVFEN